MDRKYNLSDNLKKLFAYINGCELSKIIWEELFKWNGFDKWILGNQLVRAADSVSLNIAEGYGRHFYKEKIKFYYYSRGSLLEVVDCLRKVYYRKSMIYERCLEIKSLVDKIEINLSYLIYQTERQI